MKLSFSTKNQFGVKHPVFAIVAAAIVVTSSIIGYNSYQSHHANAYKKTALKIGQTASLSSTSGAATVSDAKINPVEKSNFPPALPGAAIATTSPTAIAPPALTAPILLGLTNASNGQTIHVKVGQSFEVDLSNVSWSQVPAGQTESSQSPWTDFNSSNTAVLNLIGDTSYSSMPGSAPGSTDGSSSQSYNALSPGTSDITAQSSTNDECGPGTICPNFVMVNSFSVTIVVDPASD